MKVMRRRRAYAAGGRSLWWQVAISSTGDGMFLTAFPLLAASFTRDPGAIAGVTVASRAPWILFSLPFGAIADRFDRRLLMVLADVVRGVVVALLAALVIAGDANVWVLYAGAFVLGTGEVLHACASLALIPVVVGKEDLEAFNSGLMAAQAATEQFIGPPLGSALFAIAPSIPFVADAVSFGGSVVLASRLPDVHGVEKPTTRVRDDVREGWRYMFGNPLLKRLAILIGTLNVFYFASESVLVLYTFDKLHAGKATFTALFLAAAVGLVVGQPLIEPVRRRFDARSAIVLSIWLWAIALIGLTFTSSAPVAIAMWFLLGLGDAFWRVLTVTLRQRITPNHLMGRVNSVHRLFGMGAIPIGAALGGFLSKAIDIRAPFAMAAIAFIVFALYGPRFLEPARGL
ncbi:MAG: MFS transporter [Actinobacteria bacterium]|nr:MFS transporter [Actinomycetota bacterium]